MTTYYRPAPDLATRTPHEAVARALEERLLHAHDALSSPEPPMPFDLYETPDALVARVAVPGVLPEDIDVTITGATLIVRGERLPPEPAQISRYYRREHGRGAFSRAVGLPFPVQAESVQADLEHGILTLTMPKLDPAVVGYIAPAPSLVEIAPAPAADPRGDGTIPAHARREPTVREDAPHG